MLARDKGLQFEKKARDWLEQRGLRLLEQNYRGRFGEIDLVMLDGETLCFIEVKYRNSPAFGGAAYSIPLSKQRKITQTAMAYVQQHRNFQRSALRFDALLMQADDSASGISIEWIANAFEAQGYDF